MASSSEEMPGIERSVSCRAPSEGVLVVAPVITPSIAGIGIPSSSAQATAVAPPIATIPAASRFIGRPCARSEAKKPRPTWVPIV